MTTALFLFSVGVFLPVIFIPAVGENDPFLGGSDVTERLRLKSLLAEDWFDWFEAACWSLHWSPG